MTNATLSRTHLHIGACSDKVAQPAELMITILEVLTIAETGCFRNKRKSHHFEHFLCLKKLFYRVKLIKSFFFCYWKVMKMHNCYQYQFLYLKL